jgi:hypothetical protein
MCNMPYDMTLYALAQKLRCKKCCEQAWNSDPVFGVIGVEN